MDSKDEDRPPVVEWELAGPWRWPDPIPLRNCRCAFVTLPELQADEPVRIEMKQLLQ